MERNELERQTKLKELLQYYYSQIDWKIKVYSNNDFVRVNGNCFNKPDLIILNAPGNNLQYKHGKNIGSPIGIELKDTQLLNTTTSGIIQAKSYLDGEYKIKKTNELFKINTMTFATTNSIKNGIISENFSDNKLIERFSWKFEIPILINHEHKLVWSFRNKYFNLDGTMYGRFEKDAQFKKY